METKEENNLEIKEENTEKLEDNIETKEDKKIDNNKFIINMSMDEELQKIREKNRLELEKTNENKKPSCQCKCIIF